MATFLSALLFYAALLLVCTAPVLVLAWRRRRTRTVSRFLVAGASVGLIAAGGTATSERLVNQCTEAGNSICLDSGFAGLQILLVGGYIVAAVAKAYILYVD